MIDIMVEASGLHKPAQIHRNFSNARTWNMPHVQAGMAAGRSALLYRNVDGYPRYSLGVGRCRQGTAGLYIPRVLGLPEFEYGFLPTCCMSTDAEHRVAFS